MILALTYKHPPHYEEILFFSVSVDDAFAWTCENNFIVYVSHFGYYIQMKYCCRYSLQVTNFAIV